MAELRTKLFLSYSKANSHWRDLFVKQLKTLVPSDALWIDRESIGGGQAWSPEIERAIEQSHCALVLITAEYLDLAEYSRKELAWLLRQAPDLIVLPVLVESCPWDQVEGLRDTQFVTWRGDEQVVDGRATLAPLPPPSSPQCETAIIDICRHVTKQLGVVGQALPGQLDALFDATQQALGPEIQLARPAVHSGTFSVIYRAKWHGEDVAVKAVPDAPRQNRIRAIVTDALPKVRRLSDPAFIRLRESNIEREPHCYVMDYVETPTLEKRLADAPGHRFDPPTVIRILAQVARAHNDAHRVGLLVGALTLGSIHADDDWNVRLSPLRIEGVLARAAYMATGQLMNWDALTYLAPEVSAGQPVNGLERDRLDLLEQYYLGLLGLELLLGRPPCEVRCFDDLAIKARFFDDPRAFFDQGDGEALSWVDTSPALAHLLIRLLARAPADRIGSSDAVARELETLAAGELPASLRRQLDDDLDRIRKDPAFTDAFYTRLVTARPKLEGRFGDREKQARMLSAALPDLLAFDPVFPRNSRFQEHIDRHAGYCIDGDDVEAFRGAFLAQVDATFGGRAGHVEAWRAALDRGLAAMARQLAAR